MPVSYTHLDVYKRQDDGRDDGRDEHVPAAHGRDDEEDETGNDADNSDPLHFFPLSN